MDEKSNETDKTSDNEDKNSIDSSSHVTEEQENNKDNDDSISQNSTDNTASKNESPVMSCDDDVSMKTNDAIDDTEDLKNEYALSCKLCSVDKCPIWRRGDGQDIICNLCHLKRQKAALVPAHLKLSAGNSSHQKKDNPCNVRTSSRKNKAKKKFPNSIYNDRIIKNGNIKNRRNMFKKRPSKSADDSPSVMASNSVYHDGIFYQVGDIVSTSDLDGGTYFAQIRGFLQDSYCEKCAVVTWLIPLKANQHTFDPMLFTPGYDEEKPRPMSCFNFTCRAPTDLYKSRILHPPLQRTCANLENLFTAANIALQAER